MRIARNADFGTKTRGYERLVGDPDASSKMTSDKSYESSPTPELEHVLVLQRAPASDVAR